MFLGDIGKQNNNFTCFLYRQAGSKYWMECENSTDPNQPEQKSTDYPLDWWLNYFNRRILKNEKLCYPKFQHFIKIKINSSSSLSLMLSFEQQVCFNSELPYFDFRDSLSLLILPGVDCLLNIICIFWQGYCPLYLTSYPAVILLSEIDRLKLGHL